MIIKKQFISNKSNDLLEISHKTRANNAYFMHLIFDNILNHIVLIDNMISYLRHHNIQWVVMDINFYFERSINAVWFKHKYNRNIYYHIEDFRDFYLKNMHNFINTNNIYISYETDLDKEWIVVMDKKKIKKNKLISLRKDIEQIQNTII